MKLLNKFTVLYLAFCSFYFSAYAQKQTQLSLEKGFSIPPDSVKPWVYWYWINGNISQEGITKDLETMANVGIGEAFIGNIGLPDIAVKGNVHVLSNKWWDLTLHAFHEAARVGVKLGMFNSPGWSQSGGPWVKPSDAMRYLTTVDTIIKGPAEVNIVFAHLPKNFQQVAVLAYPHKEYPSISGLSPVIEAYPAIPSVNYISDGDTSTTILFPKGAKEETITIKLKGQLTARSIVIYPAPVPIRDSVELQAYHKGNYIIVKKFLVDRSNPALNVGPVPYAPIAISLPDIRSNQFRLKFTHIDLPGGLTEINISNAPVVEDYAEKSLDKMFQTPHPLWDSYMWNTPPETDSPSAYIHLQNIKNITGNVSADGTIRWNVPKGQWVISRIGMVPTGVTNSPAPPEATGLEVDKMNKQALQRHFDAFVKKIYDRIPPADRKAFAHIVEDSYEVGSENWTDNFDKDFEKKYGYDPLPWLPVLSGHVIGSQDQSDRFLWDMRRLIADKISYDYVGGLRELSEQYGLRSWLENYGHWGYPGEFLQYGSQSSDISGEFWAEGDLGSIELRDASSSAHIYGKNQVWAESFTAAGTPYQRYPGYLKKKGDWSFTEGINHTLLHVYIEQAYDSMPGMNAWFGTEFNRQNTWFIHSKAWIDYIRRCNFMLQQGKPANDICYFIGEDAPKMSGIRDPEIPRGYSYDYINAEVILQRLSVKDGNLVLPDGVSYKLLVLPPQNTMRPELLKKISELVAQGATILGNPPLKSPSLQNYPSADNQVKDMAASLWQNADGVDIKQVKYGKGNVLRGMTMPQSLQFLKLAPDMQTAEDSILFIHRRLPNGDIYFLTNQSDQKISTTLNFRVKDKQPELWNAITGERRVLTQFTVNKETISVPLVFEPAQSWFVVFRTSVSSNKNKSSGENFPLVQTLFTLNGKWIIQFDTAMRGPVQPVVCNVLRDWSTSTNDSIKYYSGTAVYHTSFNVDAIPSGKKIILDLGDVKNIAAIKLNGQSIQTLWTNPWTANISKALKSGKNELDIEVTNTWVNRLIGDSKLPANERKTWSSVESYKPSDPLRASGLLGPVKVEIFY